MKVQNKKVLSVLLIIVIIMAMLSLNAFAASSTQSGEFSLSDVKASAGDSFTITLTCDKNPGIFGAGVDISYDKTAFTFVKEVYDGTFCKESNLTINGADAGAIHLVFVSDSVTQNYTSTGKVVSFTFKVNGTAVNNDYEFKMTGGDPGNTINVDATEIKFAYKSAKVSVSGGIAPENTTLATTTAAPKTKIDADGNVIVYAGGTSAMADQNTTSLTEQTAKDLGGTIAAEQNKSTDKNSDSLKWILPIVAVVVVIAVVIIVLLLKRKKKPEENEQSPDDKSKS